MADSSLNSPRRTLSLSKERVTVSLLDSDESAAAFFLSEEHGLKPSEVYGFVGSISTIVTTAIFLAWAYIPECWLHYLGITYYPSRYWALAVPAYAMVIVFLAIGFYLGLNFMVTPPPTSFNTIYGKRQLLDNLVFKGRDYSVPSPATIQIVEAHYAPHVGPWLVIHIIDLMEPTMSFDLLLPIG